MDDEKQERLAYNQIASDFYHWIMEARQLVDSHFPNELSSAHNALIIETAKSMMMMHKLGSIEMAIDDMRIALIKKERS